MIGRKQTLREYKQFVQLNIKASIKYPPKRKISFQKGNPKKKNGGINKKSKRTNQK